MDNINIFYKAPEAIEYNDLRVKAGMSPKDIEASTRGLENSLFAISLRDDDKLIGMGRVVGDGGCFFHVVDIAVHPDYQRRGYGKLIMTEIVKYLDKMVPESSSVSLIADIPANKLYEKVGFVDPQPISVGMLKYY